MAERDVVLDPAENLAQPSSIDHAADALREATRRAERAEAELAKVRQSALDAPRSNASSKEPMAETTDSASGEAELRKDSMMAHLLDSLAEGKDIGHYGRLVFAMVARHFLAHEEVLAWMKKDRDVDEEKALLMLRQVEGKDYSPPRRDKILAYQAQQEFPILPFPDDPDCGNLYRNLKFPLHIYEHIGQYQEAKIESEV